MGLWTRLNSHASGHRSGDRFNIYIADQFVLTSLDAATVAAIAGGHESFDLRTRNFIHAHLSYRFVTQPSGKHALDLETKIRRGHWAGDRPPLLNPK